MDFYRQTVPQPPKNSLKKKSLKILLLLAVLMIPLYFLGKRITQSNRSVPGTATQATATDTDQAGLVAAIPVTHAFNYPLSGRKDDAKGPFITFTVESAEKRNQIIVQGNKATAAEGRVFVIINLKITNTNDKGVRINTRDFFRLAVSNNHEEWLAPDIHNDPVEVQAISTKFVRLGFPVDVSAQPLELQAGPINGEKHITTLPFPEK